MRSPLQDGGDADRRWELVAPPHTAAVVDEISRFRGRILHAGGRRPAFSRGNGQFADHSCHDPISYHVTVRQSQTLIACVRLTPYTAEGFGAVGTLIGAPRLRAVLGTMGLSSAECMEGSRWIVEPSVRGRDLGRMLLVSVWAVGRWFGKKCLFGAAGTRDGQDRMIQRAGGRVAPGDILVRTEEYDDDLLIMYFDLYHPPPPVAASLPVVNSLLNLTGWTQPSQAPVMADSISTSRI